MVLMLKELLRLGETLTQVDETVEPAEKVSGHDVAQFAKACISPGVRETKDTDTKRPTA